MTGIQLLTVTDTMKPLVLFLPYRAETFSESELIIQYYGSTVDNEAGVNDYKLNQPPLTGQFSHSVKTTPK